MEGVKYEGRNGDAWSTDHQEREAPRALLCRKAATYVTKELTERDAGKIVSKWGGPLVRFVKITQQRLRHRGDYCLTNADHYTADNKLRIVHARTSCCTEYGPHEYR